MSLHVVNQVKTIEQFNHNNQLTHLDMFPKQVSQWAQCHQLPNHLSQDVLPFRIKKADMYQVQWITKLKGDDFIIKLKEYLCKFYL
jgi:hypothetical protein